MTREEFVQLNRPSELIRVAVADARSLDRKKYFPDSVKFHESPYGENCHVCLAGAVIARTLNADMHRSYRPGYYEYDIGCRLLAIDALRVGNLKEAVFNLGWHKRTGFDKSAILSTQNRLQRPVACNFLGWADMDKHLDSMEEYAGALEAEGY